MTQGEDMETHMNWLRCTSSWAKTIAEHADTSSYVLGVLASHADVDVRELVADHLSTLPETIKLLAKDTSVDLRYAIAENHNIDEDVLMMLTEDDNPFVAHRARKTLKRLQNNLLRSFRPVLLDENSSGNSKAATA